jgi:hypothetical protein
MGAIRTFQKNDDWCKGGEENPDQNSGESSHASAPIYFIIEERGKVSQPQCKYVLKLLFNV